MLSHSLTVDLSVQCVCGSLFASVIDTTVTTLSWSQEIQLFVVLRNTQHGRHDPRLVAQDCSHACTASPSLYREATISIRSEKASGAFDDQHETPRAPAFGSDVPTDIHRPQDDAARPKRPSLDLIPVNMLPFSWQQTPG